MNEDWRWKDPLPHPQVSALLGSGGMRTPAQVSAWSLAVQRFLTHTQKVLLIPWASATPDSESATWERIQSQSWTSQKNVSVTWSFDSPAAILDQMSEAECVYVSGGNTFLLLKRMQQIPGLIEGIKRRATAGQLKYVGVSAGSNLACPTVQTTNDMPIAWPPYGPVGLGLIPFQINPHFFSGPLRFEIESEGNLNGDLSSQWVTYGGETRTDRIEEFLTQHGIPVVGLWEGSWLRVGDGRVDFFPGVGPLADSQIQPKPLLFLRGQQSRQTLDYYKGSH